MPTPTNKRLFEAYPIEPHADKKYIAFKQMWNRLCKTIHYCIVFKIYDIIELQRIPCFRSHPLGSAPPEEVVGGFNT